MSDIKSIVLDKKAAPFERLVALIEVLRSPNGCPWDRKQNHQSLLPYLIEEAYEVLEAVESENYEALCEELGDLLCQIILHAQLAKEAERFAIDDSITHAVEKLIARHPHVFDKQRVLTPQQVRDQWEQLKVKEKNSVLSGIPRSMPALTMAFRIGEKAGGVGFDWRNGKEVLDKLKEEMAEISQAIQAADKKMLTEEIGDLLFATASLARKMEVDPEQALKKALNKFMGRFKLLEEHINKSGKSFQDYSLEELEQIWQEIK